MIQYERVINLKTIKDIEISLWREEHTNGNRNYKIFINDIKVYQTSDMDRAKSRYKGKVNEINNLFT